MMWVRQTQMRNTRHGARLLTFNVADFSRFTGFESGPRPGYWKDHIVPASVQTQSHDSPPRTRRRVGWVELRGRASIQTEMENWQLPLSLSRRKPGSMLLPPRTSQSDSSALPAITGSRGRNDGPRLSPGKIKWFGFRTILAQPQSAQPILQGRGVESSECI
jgi:hypothetical protein